MAVKETKKEICKRVRIRRDAVSGQTSVQIVSSPPGPRTLASLRYSGNVLPVSNRPISPLLSPEIPEDTPSTPFVHDRRRTAAPVRDVVDCRGLSVDWVLDSPYVEVARVLRQLDLLADSDLIVEIMLHFSLVIKGLPDCPDEDLPLAVYLFIEDTFSIRSRLVKCVKIRSYDGKMDVGVIFDSIRMKYDVLKKDELLEGTEVRMINNFTLTWFNMYPGAQNP